MLNVSHHQGTIEITDRYGRRVLITEDDLTSSGMIVTFPSGAYISGHAPFAFAYEEGDISSMCTQPFNLSVRI